MYDKMIDNYRVQHSYFIPVFQSLIFDDHMIIRTSQSILTNNPLDHVEKSEGLMKCDQTSKSKTRAYQNKYNLMTTSGLSCVKYDSL